MGNCQAIDSVVIQHPNGKVDKLYWPIAASEMMKMNPGHYVALLLLTTTLYSSPATTPPLRVTKIKLLRPTDTLLLGHVYRLLTYKEVVKGLSEKKQAKIKQLHNQNKIITNQLTSSDFHHVGVVRKQQSNKQVKHENRQSRSINNTQVNSGVAKSRGWQPSLRSISESGS